MNKSIKVLLIVAFSLILLGGIIFCGAMINLKWDFEKIATVKYQENKYEISESFKAIKIDANIEDIEIVLSEDGKASVVFYEQENVKHSASIRNDMLEINSNDTRKWYEHIGTFSNTPKIILYIPKKEYEALNISTITGDAFISADVNFKNIHVYTDTGDVENCAAANGEIRIKTSTGDIVVKNISAQTTSLETSTGKISLIGVESKGVYVSVSTGKVIAEKVNCDRFFSEGSTGTVEGHSIIALESLVITRSTGDVDLKESNSKKIYIETGTGDVECSLLNSKEFVTKTSTGKVNVPESNSQGGRCEIITDTGDIDVRVN